MQQPVHLRELLSAARHVKRIDMKQEELVCFAAESFNKVDSNCQGNSGLTASVKNRYAQDFDKKEENTDDDQTSEMYQILNENTRRGT